MPAHHHTHTHAHHKYSSATLGGGLHSPIPEPLLVQSHNPTIGQRQRRTNSQRENPILIHGSSTGIGGYWKNPQDFIDFFCLQTEPSNNNHQDKVHKEAQQWRWEMFDIQLWLESDFRQAWSSRGQCGRKHPHVPACTAQYEHNWCNYLCTTGYKPANSSCNEACDIWT